jgi:mRNA-degrading endonuclease toxin of MazEF toxin-antitoxin module
MIPRTGEIWWVEYGQPHPQQPALRRPALVISPAEPETWSYENLVTVPFTKRNRNKCSEIQINPNSDTGLSITSWAQCELVRSMPFNSFLHRMGHIDSESWHRIRWTVQSFLDFD